MYTVKLPYYPKVESVVTETRFGALEISTPTIYETPLCGIKIVRLDALECLRPVLGDDCLKARNTVYSIVSGSGDIQSYRERLANCYKQYPKVTSFINSVYEYGYSDKPLDSQVSVRLMEIVNEYLREMMQLFDNAGGKYLVSTHLYIYFKFSNVATLPVTEGVKVIC